jgi:uncharacterized protein (TIGR03086 family)
MEEPHEVSKIAESYRRRADAFEALVGRVPSDRWSSPSPCEGWTARDVVRHVVDYSASVLEDKAGVPEAPKFADHAEPVAAFHTLRGAVERVLDDPETPHDVAAYLDGAVSVDLPQHGWDLAMATGQDATMDPRDVDWLWNSLSEHERVWQWQRDNGWYGQPRPTPKSSSRQDQVLALLGRDPSWTPPLLGERNSDR